jgi:hypothetical protein
MMKTELEKRNILLSAVAESKGYYYDNGLVDKSTDQIVATTDHEVAKVLFGQMTKEQDIETVESILSIVTKIPNYESLLKDSKDVLAESGIELPAAPRIESHQTGTPGWFRRMMNALG